MQRSRWILTLLLLTWCGRVQAAITHVGASQGASGSTATVSVTRAAGSTSNLYLVACQSASSTPTLANTTTPFTWTKITDTTYSTSSHIVTFWAIPSTTASQTITCSGLSGGFGMIQLDEFSGTATTTPIDVSQGFTSTTSCGATSSSMGQNNEVVIANITDTVTAVGNINGSVATKGADDSSMDWSEYRILSGTGSGSTITAAYTGSATGAACNVASIKPLAVAPSSPNRLLLGVGP